MSDQAPARPVLKWAGGKSQLVPTILKRLPSAIDTYYEPFIGGAAVFFALAAEGRFRRAVLSDTNPELVSLYRTIQDDVEGLISALLPYRERYSEEEYYRVRAAKPPRKAVERAARLIFLNKTGYNGLYRVNRSGQYNVPFGRYKNPNICDAKNLRAAAASLQGVRIEQGDFSEWSRRARSGDVVYFDPPYLPVSKTASFRAYDKHAFGLAEHQRLAVEFGRLAKRKIVSLLSNSDTPVTRELFAEFLVETVSATRAINSNGQRRGPINEILVSSSALDAEPKKSRRKVR